MTACLFGEWPFNCNLALPCYKEKELRRETEEIRERIISSTLMVQTYAQSRGEKKHIKNELKLEKNTWSCRSLLIFPLNE